VQSRGLAFVRQGPPGRQRGRSSGLQAWCNAKPPGAGASVTVRSAR
jgi:hypothetical protein